MRRWLLGGILVLLVSAIGVSGWLTMSNMPRSESAVETVFQPGFEHPANSVSRAVFQPETAAIPQFVQDSEYSTSRFEEPNPRARFVSEGVAVPNQNSPNPVRQQDAFDFVQQDAEFSNAPTDQFFAGPEPPSGDHFGPSTSPFGMPQAPASGGPMAGEQVDLLEGMSYLIRVSRQEEGEHSQLIQRRQVYGGKQVTVLDISEPHAATELRIYSEAVELTSTGGKFQLQCEGKVIVVTEQSMLRGDGLVFEDGQFSIQSTEIVTPDTKIKAGETTFEFLVGGVSIDTIVHPPKPEEPPELEPLPQIEGDPPFEFEPADGAPSL